MTLIGNTITTSRPGLVARMTEDSGGAQENSNVHTSVTGTAPPVLPFFGGDDHAAEQYKILRTKLVQHPRQPRLITISSPSVGDGKSVTALNIAAVLSLKQTTPVLLVEADCRRPSLCRLLNMPSSRPGLTDVLEGEIRLSDALVHFESLPNLHLLSVQEAANPTELFDSAAWKTLCEQFRNQFAYTIFDAPPVGVVADFDLIQSTSDGVVLVIRPDHTDRGACTHIFETVPRERLLGVVMNCATDLPWSHRKRYYDYGYYGGRERRAAPDAGSNPQAR
jgi:capsular exopolysaccharide synthesis family protein